MKIPMKGLRDESGQALVLTVLCMSALLGFVALAADVGLLFRAKRNLQIYADAAATAGALDYYNTASSTSALTAAENAAKNAAKGNGITTWDAVFPFNPQSRGSQVTATTSEVDIYNPVTTGAHTGSGTVEVDIIQPNPSFLGFWGFGAIKVAAKAVAGSVPPQSCIFLTGSGDDLIVKNASVTAVGGGKTCGIYAAGNVNVTGNANYINAAYIDASGTLTGNHNTNPAPVVTNAPTQTLPSSLSVAAHSVPASCGLPSGATSTTNNQGITIYTATITLPMTTSTSTPTCYGVDATPNPGTSILNLTLANGVTMGNGLYIFDLGTSTVGNGASAVSGGTLTLGSVTGGCSTCGIGTVPGGPGVTLDINTGNFSVTSTANPVLYAPSDALATDAYTGVLLLEPATNTGTINIQWGSASGTLTGYIIAPGANLTMQDHGGDALVTGIVASTLTINSSLIINNYGTVYDNGPQRSIALVE